MGAQRFFKMPGAAECHFSTERSGVLFSAPRAEECSTRVRLHDSYCAKNGKVFPFLKSFNNIVKTIAVHMDLQKMTKKAVLCMPS